MTAGSPVSRSRDTPSLSVVIALGSQRDRGAMALAALLEQSLASQIEVLLLDVGHERFPPVAGADRPGVRVVPTPPESGYGDVLALGVREARAPIVAFVEEHVRVLPGWADAIVRAHRGPWAAVCGELQPGDVDRSASRRIELVSRNRWSPPARRGETDVLRWQNVSYKRDVLLRYGDRLPLFLQSEGTFFRRLRADGERLFIEPEAQMVHAHEMSWLKFLIGSFHSNRLAAASSAASSEERLRLLVSAVSGPLRWPVVLLRRTRSLPDSRIWQRRFWRYLPFVIQYYATASVASLVGLILGPGDSPRRFLEFEINAPRNIVSRVS